MIFPDLGLLILGEHVEAERLLPVVDEVHGLVGTLHVDEGEDRAEDLLLHDGVGRIDIAEHGDGDEQVRLVVLPTCASKLVTPIPRLEKLVTKSSLKII